MGDILWLNWAMLILVVAVLIYLGVRASRIARSGDEEGFLIAGRTIGPFVGAGTIMATGFSGWGFVGAAGVTYEFGMIEVLGNFFFAPAIVIATLFFASSLRRRAWDIGSNTLPEYVGRWHGTGRWDRILQAVAALITIPLLLVFFTSQLTAIGLLAASYLNIPAVAGAGLLLAVIVVYTVSGGLAGVAWTDTLMVVGMSVAAVVVVIRVFADAGPAELVAQLNAIDPELLNPSTAEPYGQMRGSVFLVLPYAFMFAAVLPYMAIRFLSFRPETKMTTVALYGAPLGVLLSLVPIVGLFMRANGPVLDNPDNAMPVFLDTFLHPAVGGVIALFIMFAMKSTANSLVHTISTAFSHDLRAAVFRDRDITPARALLLNRMWVVVVGLIGFFMMLFAPPLFLNFMGILGTGTLFAALTGPVFVSTFWRGNAVGALVAMIGGFVTSGSLLVLGEMDITANTTFVEILTSVGWVEGPLLGAVVSAVLYIVVSKATMSSVPAIPEPAARTEAA